MLYQRIFIEKYKNTYYVRDTEGEIPRLEGTTKKALREQIVKILLKNESKRNEENRRKRNILSWNEKKLNFYIRSKSEKRELRIGFVGSNKKVTKEQINELSRWLEHSKSLMHGGRKGDRRCHKLAHKRSLMREAFRVIVRPELESTVDYFDDAEKIYRSKEKFHRFRQIAIDSDLIVIAPDTEWETKGGTWYTKNYAKELRKAVLIIFPDGTTRMENFSYEI